MCVKTFECVAHISLNGLDLAIVYSPVICLCPLRSQLTEHEKEVTGLEVKLEKVRERERERERKRERKRERERTEGGGV